MTKGNVLNGGDVKHFGELRGRGDTKGLTLHRVGHKKQKAVGIFYLKNAYQYYGRTTQWGGGVKRFYILREGHECFLHARRGGRA